MKWFGPSWGAPVCEEPHVETPTEPCASCGSPFIEGDQGILVPFYGHPGDPPELPYHHGCFMWLVGATTVHVVRNGRSLCGKFALASWPEGGKETWRYYDGGTWRREASCPGCRRAAHAISTQVA